MAEDVRLDRVFRAQVSGFYIDVGAAHPVVDSVTKHFSNLGWRGVHVEPDRRLAAELERDRPGDVVISGACSDHVGEIVVFETGAGEGWSTVEESARETVETALGATMHPRPVACTTLASICAEHVTGPIDFLKIDVEGHELPIIRGADWRRWRPRVVVVEATEPNRPVPNHGEWEDVLIQARYRFVLFDGLNRFYVRAEEPALVAPLSAPANVFDDYVPYEHVRALQQAQARAAVAEGLGPRALAVARFVHRLHDALRRWRRAS